jgi:PAS domain S-box-containing protein
MQIERLAEAFAGFDDRHHSITISDARSPDMPLVYVNIGFTLFSGYTREDAVGRNCRFLQNGRSDQPGIHTMRQAIRERRGCLVDLVNYKRCGALLLNRLSLHPVFDGDRELIYYIGLQSNVEPLARVQRRLAEHFAARGLTVDDLLG